MRAIVDLAITAALAASESSLAVEEIVVSGVRGESPAPPATVFAIDADDLTDIRAVSLSDALARAPSASLQTNSRGETLVFLRGAGERQTALFFDGASLNVPWDNRLDLSLLPTRAVANISTTPGVSSVLYGANASGGVIEIIPVSEDTPASLDAQGGEGGFFDGGAVLSGRIGEIGGVISGGFTRRDGAPTPRDADLAFSQFDSALRTNTDFSRVNGFARIETALGSATDISASLLAVDADYGIAPEGHLDPEEDNVRFWRYPQSRHIVGVLNVSSRLSSNSAIRSAFWVQQFNQTIESYASAQYAQIEDLQVDSDRTYGARVIAEHQAGAHALRGVVTLIDARHRQTDIAFADGAPPDETPEADRFRRRTISLGGEYDFTRGATRISFGAGGDLLQSLNTGGRPDAGDFSTWNLIGGVEQQLNNRWSVALSAGRKTRLPTQRELFGDAINRFLINPDLKAENAVLVEAPLRFESAGLSFSIAPFANFTSDTIDQRNVVVDGARLRQRINLRGSRGFGVEAFGAASLTDRLSLTGNITAQRLRRRPETGMSDDRFLSERPEFLARASLNYIHPNGWRGSFEALHRGRAFSLDQNDVFVPLTRSTSFNAEIAYAFTVTESEIDLFLRADNLTDALTEPQLGLPGSGRLLRAGVRVSLL